MRDLTHTKDITEGKATDAIFNACRANPERKNTEDVSFNWYGGSDMYEAVLRNAEGFVVAIAIVDQFDC